MGEKRMNSGKKKSRIAYLFYTILFLFTLSTVLFYFWRYDKSMVWDCDGVYQHFNSFVYYGEYLRNILRNLWENHTLSVPMWDMSIGYGADILTTLNYYAIGDPLALLSVFARPEKAEYMYGFVILLRLYLAGFFFLMYCRFHGNSDRPSVLGALTYCFCGFSLFAFSRHPAFINPMIYFPLILIGIDKIFNRERSWLFIVMTAISAISNFYFFYMICVLMFLYAVVRYITIFKKIRIKELLGWLMKFIGYYAVGLGIAAVLFLPGAMCVLKSARMSVKNDVPLLYSFSHYGKIIRDLLNVDYVSTASRYYTVLGVVPLLLLAVFVMLIKVRKYRDIKAGFFILAAILCIPFFGHVMNGFSYVSNRWIWGFHMLFSYILVKVYPELLCLKRKEKWALLVLCVLYGGVVILLPGRAPHIILMLLILLALCAAVAVGDRPKIKRYIPSFLYGMTILSIGLNAYFLYSPEQTDYISDFRKQGSPYKMLTTYSEGYPVKKLEDDSEFYRYEQYGSIAHQNTAMQNKLYSTDFYFSVANGAVSRFLSELDVVAICDYMYNNLDGRTILDRLASVKYYVTRKGRESYVPYGYGEKAGGNKKFAVYKTEDALPFGYTYENSVSQEVFDSLTVAQKQQALLQGAVTGESDLPEAELSFCDVRPEITVTGDENVVVDGNRFEVAKSGGIITISFEGLPESETYLVMEHIVYDGQSPQFALKADMGETGKRFVVYTDRHSFYGGKDDFLCNLGYTQETPSQITLKFSAKGTYTFDDLYVVSQPLEQVDAQTAKLCQDVMQDVVFSDNKISGTISLASNKMLVLSMAYSKGWKAKVDGKEQELKQVNMMFSGLELSAGEHTIELTYSTPYLKAGILISLLGILILCVIIWRESRMRGRKMPLQKSF